MRESLQHWEKRHGGASKAIADHEHQKIYYPDGAWRELTSEQYGIWKDPTGDAWETSKLIVHYWTLQLKKWSQKFDAAKFNLESRNAAMSRPGGPAYEYDEDELKPLRQLQKWVQWAKKHLKEAKKEEKSNKPAWMAAKEAESVENTEIVSNNKSKLARIRI